LKVEKITCEVREVALNAGADLVGIVSATVIDAIQ
jgi:hypothetical protein